MTNLYISKEHIQEIINYRQSISSHTTEPLITNKDKKFCKEFLTWLTNLIYEFQANVYTAIHYHLYTRFWEFQDIEDFNLSKRADILKKTIEYKREAD